MKFIGKVINEKGIALVILTIAILISVVVISMIFKAVFDAQSIGVTEVKEKIEDLIRKIC